jgi:hypothetical protein
MVAQTDAKNRVPTEQRVFVGTNACCPLLTRHPILHKRETTQGDTHQVKGE